MLQQTSPNLHTGGTRGIIAGGRNNGSGRNYIQFANAFHTTGNFQDFGDLTSSNREFIVISTCIWSYMWWLSK